MHGGSCVLMGQFLSLQLCYVAHGGLCAEFYSLGLDALRLVYRPNNDFVLEKCLWSGLSGPARNGGVTID